MSLLKSALSLVLALFIVTMPSCATVPTVLNNTISPRDSFVKLSIEEPGGFSGSGSGVIIHHIEDTTFILTAGHICLPLGSKIKATDIGGIVHETIILKVSETADLCLIISLKRIDRPISKIAKKMVTVGSRVYTFSAPYGIHAPDMVLKFEGYYAGRVKLPGINETLEMHTLPTRPGSSGSPVYNDQWEIIGITSRAYSKLEHAGLYTTLYDVHVLVNGMFD